MFCHSEERKSQEKGLQSKGLIEDFLRDFRALKSIKGKIFKGDQPDPNLKVSL